MTWVDDFLDDISNATGLDGSPLLDVILALPQNAAERRRRAQEQAQQRARALLLAHLNDEQRAEFLAEPVSCMQGQNRYTPNGRPSFRTRGSDGGRYCVHLGREHNIWMLDESGRHASNFCYHVRDPVPNEDNVLAQLLFIEGDESGFLRVANRS